jgi:hypothetical protein
MPRLSKEVKAYMEKEKEIVRLQNELSSLQGEVEHFKQYGTFREEIKLEVSRVKTAGIILAVVLGLLAVYSLFSWHRVLGEVHRETEKTNREISTRVYGLEQGYFLYQHDFYREALPYLKDAYEKDPSDERVVTEYLDSLDRENALEQGLTVIRQLQGVPAKFNQFKTGDFYNRVGCLLLEKGFSDPGALDESFPMFNRSLQAYGLEDSRRMFPLYNLFRYWLLKGDKEKAESALVQSGWTQKYTLADISGQQWFVVMKNPMSKKIFRQMAMDFGGKGKKSDWISGGSKTLKPVAKSR